jgi:hypothetical protein
MEREKENTEEAKDANTKTVTVGGEKKLPLMDDDETLECEETISESELQEMIEAAISSIMQTK